MQIDYKTFISPNFDKRPEGEVINTIVIHHTKMKDDLSALDRLCSNESKVSAHYLINKQGKIFSLVPNHLRAWHAGMSYWRGKEKVNDFSIGIELDNNGEEEFSEELMISLIGLCYEIFSEYPIDHFNIVGHSDVAPGRKDDPGVLFNWRFLADNKIGVMPPKLLSNSHKKDISSIQEMLFKYGYKIEITGKKDQNTLDVMKAFNYHFNPLCKEDWDNYSQAALEYLINLMI